MARVWGRDGWRQCGGGPGGSRGIPTWKNSSSPPNFALQCLVWLCTDRFSQFPHKHPILPNFEHLRANCQLRLGSPPSPESWICWWQIKDSAERIHDRELQLVTCLAPLTLTVKSRSIFKSEWPSYETMSRGGFPCFHHPTSVPFSHSQPFHLYSASDSTLAWPQNHHLKPLVLSRNTKHFQNHIQMTMICSLLWYLISPGNIFPITKCAMQHFSWFLPWYYWLKQLTDYFKGQWQNWSWSLKSIFLYSIWKGSVTCYSVFPFTCHLFARLTKTTKDLCSIFGVFFGASCESRTQASESTKPLKSAFVRHSGSCVFLSNGIWSLSWGQCVVVKMYCWML